MALARKYRPQRFEELLGQPHVTATLMRALNAKRIAPAYLFTGQRGVGKTSAARILAKCLNCANGPTGTPCNACANCEQITQGQSLDVIEIDGASHRGIDEVRGLRDTVPYAPTTGSYRVTIIDEVHMLTLEAFNALLKTLEEPPAHAVFVLATTAANKVPATVLSRCQRFDFRRIETPVVVQVLSRVATDEGLAVSEPALYAIAREADGSLRDAEVILEQMAGFAEGPIEEAGVTELLGVVESDALWTWAGAILERDVPRALGMLHAQLDLGKDPQQILAGITRHFRNLLLVRSASQAQAQPARLTTLLDEPDERLSRLEEQARPFSPEELVLMLQLLAGSYELVRKSPMAQTMLELTVVKLATREQWQSLAHIAERLDQLSRGAVEEPPVSQGPPHETPAAASVPEAAQAQEPSPFPEPRSPSGGEGEGGDRAALEAVWAGCLERLGSQKMSLAAYLAEARPLRLERDVLTVGLPGVALHQEVVTMPEHRRLLSTLVSEAYGRPVTIEYQTLPAEEPRSIQVTEPPVPALVQDIVKLFNAKVVG